MGKLRFLSTLFLLGTFFQATAQLYTFRNYGHPDGLHTVAITATAQSDDGFLWIGTEGTPLVRFDGFDFVEMRAKGQDFEHHITHLDYHRDTVFFASRYKGFVQFIPESGQYQRQDININESGEALAYICVENNKYGIGTKKIYDLSSKKPKVLFEFDRFIQLYHHQKIEDWVVLFTSVGNFVLKNNKLESLHHLMKLPKDEVNQYRFGHALRNKLVLCNELGTHWLEIGISANGKLVEQRRFTRDSILLKGEKLISYYLDPSEQKVVALSSSGDVYKVIDCQLRIVPHNYTGVIKSPESIMIDLNGDYWICSRVAGLYKVSLEPFTKIRLSPIYESSEIVFPYMTVTRDVVISLRSGTTHVANYDDSEFTEFPFLTLSATKFGQDDYFGTNKGIKKFVRDGDNISFKNILFNNEKINHIIADRNYLWAGVAGKGLFRINPKTLETVQLTREKDRPVPHYFYTGQISGNGKKLFFGTNDGIFYVEKNSTTLIPLKTPREFRSYSGVSTKDVYGTVWFTLETGIVGVTKTGELRTIKGADYFETNLYYTLNSDRLGSLIVGTNRGVRILKVDSDGFVISNSVYDASSGFDGYETHMRSQYQNDNSIYVGTVEGLFLINTDILDQIKVPIRPIIHSITPQNFNTSDTQNSFYFRFHVNNPKSGKISYQYRLLGSGSKHWKNLDEPTLNLYNLHSGQYTLEVRATYDGRNFSKVSREKFKVASQFWASSWVILLVVLVIAVLNYLLVRFSRKLDHGTLIRTQDMDIHSRMVPVILLIGVFSTLGSHTLGPLLNNQLELHLPPLLALVVGLIGLFFLARAVVNAGRKHLLNSVLLAGIGLILVHLFYESYVSNLHPFHLIGIVLTCIILPYFVHGIKAMVIFTSFITLAGVILLIAVEQPVFPKEFVAIALTLLIVLLIFSSFLRANSLERLLFISGIINRGNIPAIAFNANGKIIYASENISNFIDSTHDELINHDVSMLNQFVPYEGKFKNVDVLKDFVDGNNYIVPLLAPDGKVNWIDWQYKEFGDDTKVMLGQEISEKMELENTYELLVQNAEDFIYRCDTDGNFLFLNDIIFERLGYTKADLVGKDSISIVPDDYQEEIRNYYRDHFLERKITSYKEFPILTKEEEIIWIGQHVTTIFAPGSNAYINGFIALARDITSLRRQQQLIKDQRDDITSSISYAQRIQLNLLPHERYFNSSFREHFIIYKPKDIVSGDFYWMETIDDTTVLALGDCTGHGVPGAFMTLLGINLLNSIVKENRILDPGKILDELDKRLVDILPRSMTQNSLNDGIEMTICAIEKNKDEVTYACAGSRFLIYSQESFTMLKGDNKHIGDRPHKDFKFYSSHYAPFTSEDLIYMFSDGLQDQFGGQYDKKFTFRRILGLLEESAHLPLPDQRVNMEEEISEWIGNNEQTDDITLISIKKNIT